MSVELLVLAGLPTLEAREERRRVMDHAISTVPHMVDSSRHETTTAVAALVFTAPVGGTLSSAERDDEGLRLTVATAEAGLVAAHGHEACGSEAGHVTVLLGDHGGVEVSTDGIGFLPCYWGRSTTTLMVATHLATLVSLGLPPTADEQALAEYVVTLSPLGVRTLLREATVLVAGGRLRWSPGGWTPPRAAALFSPREEPLTDGEAVSAFAAIWPEVVKDAFSGTQRSVIGLSGGLDSRSIAEAAVEMGLRPTTYTYGAPPSREPITASAVANVLGLPNVRIPVSEDRLLCGAVGALDKLDGAHSPSEMYELWFADILHGISDAVVSGSAGGTLWGDDKALGLTDASAVVAQRLRAYAGAIDASSPYLAGGLAAEIPSLLKQGLTNSLEGWDLGARADMVLFWRVLSRQLRWGNMLTTALRRSGIRAEAPFLDARFVGLAARLTAAQRRYGRLHLQVHRQLFPRTAGIPRADDGNAPRALNHIYWWGDTPHLRQLGTLVLGHPLSAARRVSRQVQHEAAGLLQRHTGLTRPADWTERRRSVFPADLWLRQRGAYADRLSELLQIGDHPLFAQDTIDIALAEIRGGRSSTPALTLGKVAAARAWLSDYENRAKALGKALEHPG